MTFLDGGKNVTIHVRFSMHTNSYSVSTTRIQRDDINCQVERENGMKEGKTNQPK